MGTEHLMQVAGAVVGVVAGIVAVAAALWKLFVEVDAWRRNRREPPNPPPPPCETSS